MANILLLVEGALEAGVQLIVPGATEGIGEGL